MSSQSITGRPSVVARSGVSTKQTWCSSLVQRPETAILVVEGCFVTAEIVAPASRLRMLDFPELGKPRSPA